MSDTELATVGPTQFQQQVSELDMGLAFFERMGRCGLFPDGIKSAADALMVAAAGKRFGFDPLESLQKFHVVKGRVSPSSDLRAGILMRSSLCVYLRCGLEAESCTSTTVRSADRDHEVREGTFPAQRQDLKLRVARTAMFEVRGWALARD